MAYFIYNYKYMSALDYKDLSRHVGHNVQCVQYGKQNVSVECEDCSEVLFDFDRYPESEE